MLYVRIKPLDPKRRHVMRRYTYRGLTFRQERGWCRVPKDVADYLRGVRQEAGNDYAPMAFDVCTEKQAKALDAKEKRDRDGNTRASDDVPVMLPRGARLGDDVDDSDAPPAERPRTARKGGNAGRAARSNRSGSSRRSRKSDSPPRVQKRGDASNDDGLDDDDADTDAKTDTDAQPADAKP